MMRAVQVRFKDGDAIVHEAVPLAIDLESKMMRYRVTCHRGSYLDAAIKRTSDEVDCMACIAAKTS